MNKNLAQNIILSTGKFDHEKEYWLQKLSDNLEGVHFPYDYSAPISEERRRGVLTSQFPVETAEALQHLSNGSTLRLYMALVALVKALLFRYTGEKGSVIITPVERQQVEGEYLNTLLFLKDELRSDTSFRLLLTQVKDTVSEARAHANYPSSLLLEHLQVTPDELFQIGVGLTNWQDEEVLAEAEPALYFTFSETNGVLQASANYHAGLYVREGIEQLLSRLFRLTQQALKNPDTSLQSLELLTTEEKSQILHTFNQTAQTYSTDDNVVDLFEAQVRRTPEAISVESEGRQLTYHELNARANQLARRLVALGVGPDTLVGVMLEPSVEIMVGIVGILKAGGAYIPIDPAYPAERISYMMSDARSQVLVTASKYLNQVQNELNGQILCLDNWAEFATEEMTNLERQFDLHNLAYCIYTSGSTGQPKGVLIEHRSLLNLTKWHKDDVQITSADRFGKYASFSFDASIIEIFPYLTAGAALVMVPQELKSDMVTLAKWYSDKRITATFLPTNLAEIMGRDFPHLPLRHLIIGGDKLRTFLKSDYPVINCYGPTENTCVSTVFTVGVDEYDPFLNNVQHREQMVPPIGKPVPNTEVYILDAELNPVPINVVGEIYLAGVHVARGYLHRPELTAERFIANPFKPGSKMYKSGDLGRWRMDGNIEFLGRIDQQVKIRGFRIELGEIESRIMQYPAVKGVSVQVQPDDAGGQQLVGYLMLKEQLKVSDLRKYLKEALPEYMIPTVFISLDELPLTPNGKVDRKALPKPLKALLLTDREYAAPRNEVEAVLARIWEEVLRVERVGIYDNFFELGGHSIKATQVLSRIYKEMGVQLPIRIFFQAANIAVLAEKVKLAEKGVYQTIKPQPQREHYPLTHAQKRLWLFDQMTEGNIAYNMPAAFILRGALNLDAFRRAFQTVVDRHEILRTRYQEVAGEPVQIVEADYRFHLDYQPVIQGSLEEYVMESLRAPFDLSKPGLIRASLTQLQPDEHLLITNMHHIVSDGWSVNVLVQEVAVLYNAYRRGEFNPLEPLPIQFRDYAVWQNETMVGGTLAEQEKYWLNQLQGELSVLRLPYDDIAQKPVESSGASDNLLLDKELTAALRQVALAEDATLYMVLTAALLTVFYKLTGKTDIMLGTSSAGRSHEQLERLIGFFVNTLVLRADLKGDLEFTSLVRQVREHSLAMHDNQDYPYDRLLEQLMRRGQAFQGELFTIMINYLMDQSEVGVALDGLAIEPMNHNVEEAKFDLSFYVQEMPETVAVQVLYKTHCFKAETIRTWLDYLLNILTMVNSEPERKLSQIQLVSEEAYSSFLDDFNEDL